MEFLVAREMSNKSNISFISAHIALEVDLKHVAELNSLQLKIAKWQSNRQKLKH